MPKTNAAIADYLSLVFQNVGWSNVGDATGLLPSGTTGNLYVSLHTADPGPTGDQSTSEAAYAGYARQPVVRSSGGWTVATPAVTNVSTITFPPCTSGTETETYFGVGTAVSGTGHLLYWGPLAAKVISFVAETSGNAITIPGHSLSVDDRIAFFTGTPDDTFPTGPTQGTLYYVKTVSGDVITISATSGGSVITISASGSGTCAKIVSFAVSTGTIPTIFGSALVILEN